MIKKHIGVGLIVLGLLLSVGSIAAPAQAASLTSAQVQAIIGLLQSFGADQNVINNVSADLGGSSSSLSCSSFTDLTYGSFDNNPGGRVSQLQTWLGIPSNTFGFGTYGRKTQAAWNARCGGTQTTTSTVSNTNTNTVPANTQTGTQNISVSFTAMPTSGAAPLSVTFTSPYGSPSGSGISGYHISFGDGATQDVVCAASTTVVCNTPVQIQHTYATPGTYTATLFFGKLNEDGATATQVITATGNSTNFAPSVTVTSVSGTSVSATYANIPAGIQAEIDLVNQSTGVGQGVGQGIPQGGNGSVVINAPASSIASGTYILKVEGGGTQPLPQSSPFSLIGTAPICSVSVNPASITLGQSATVQWTSSGATSATSDITYWSTGTGSAQSPISVNGSQTVTPTAPINYSFWFTGPGGNVTCVAKLNVVIPLGATIDQSSLTTTSTMPTITGSASGVTQVSIDVVPGTGLTQGKSIFVSSLMPVTNGRWSANVSTSLQPGSYTVYVEDSDGAPALTSGTLTVQ